MRAADNDKCYLRPKLVEIAVVGQKPVPRLVRLSIKEIIKNLIKKNNIQGGPTNVAQLWRLITLRFFIENTRIIYQIKDKYLVYAHTKYCEHTPYRFIVIRLRRTPPFRHNFM